MLFEEIGDDFDRTACAVGTLEAEKTAEQLEAEALEARRVEEASRRDQVLLTTYLSIEEIEQLRRILDEVEQNDDARKQTMKNNLMVGEKMGQNNSLGMSKNAMGFIDSI